MNGTTCWRRVRVTAGIIGLLGLTCCCGGGMSQRGPGYAPTAEDPEELIRAEARAYGELKGEPLCRSDEATYRKDGEPVFRAVDENGLPTPATRDEKKRREAELVASAYGWSGEHVAYFHPRYVASWQATGPRTERLWICTHPRWIEDYEVRNIGLYCPSKGLESPSKKEAAARLICEAEIINEVVKGCVSVESTLASEEFERSASAERSGLAPSITKTSVEFIDLKGVTCARVGCYVKKANRAAFDADMAKVKKECPVAK